MMMKENSTGMECRKCEVDPSAAASGIEPVGAFFDVFAAEHFVQQAPIIDSGAKLFCHYRENSID